MVARTKEKWIDEIVGALSDPVIVMPGGWGEDLPPWLREAITLERLVANMVGIKTGVMTATDAEACAYLFTASLTAPIGHDWTQIYLYVTGKVYETRRTPDSGVKMPEDIRVEKLSDYQIGMLNQLKSLIYEARVKHRKTKRKKEESIEQLEQANHETVQLSFDLGLGR